MVYGVHPNGDILGTAEIEVFGCGPGRLELTLLGKQATPVEISANGRPELTVAPATDTVWNGSVPSPGPTDNGRCTFDIRSPGLVGSTRIEFVAAAPEPTGA